MFYGFDSTWLLILPGLLLAWWAQHMVNRAFNDFSQIPSRGGWTGAAMARRMLDANGLQNVRIEAAAGNLTDNYNPRSQTLNLSQGVHSSTSLAALGVAAHEVGHAVQHGRHYAPMALRSALVPVANIGSYAAWPLLLAGLLFSFTPLVYAGIFVFAFAVLFQLVTLPVEFNASRRGLRMLAEGGYLSDEEVAGARRVLTAAALTYLAATLMAVLQFLRLLLIANGGRRRND